MALSQLQLFQFTWRLYLSVAVLVPPCAEEALLRKRGFLGKESKNSVRFPSRTIHHHQPMFSRRDLAYCLQSILTYMASRAAVPAPGHLSRHGRGVLAGLATSYVITSSALMLWSEIFSLFTFKGCVSELGLRSLTRRRNRLAFLLAPVATSLGAAMSSGNQDGGRG